MDIWFLLKIEEKSVKTASETWYFTHPKKMEEFSQHNTIFQKIYILKD